jgi:hypothetical protein
MHRINYYLGVANKQREQTTPLTDRSLRGDIKNLAEFTNSHLYNQDSDLYAFHLDQVQANL